MISSVLTIAPAACLQTDLRFSVSRFRHVDGSVVAMGVDGEVCLEAPADAAGCAAVRAAAGAALFAVVEAECAAEDVAESGQVPAEVTGCG